MQLWLWSLTITSSYSKLKMPSFNNAPALQWALHQLHHTPPFSTQSMRVRVCCCQNRTCETPSSSVNFMDMTIAIVDNHIETKLFEKDMNLYLYLPPHSSHPQGVFTGLICGQILPTRRLCLCTHSKDADTSSINDFFGQIVTRGRKQESLAPLFLLKLSKMP